MYWLGGGEGDRERRAIERGKRENECGAGLISIPRGQTRQNTDLQLAGTAGRSKYRDVP